MNYSFEDIKKSEAYTPDNTDPKEEGFEFNGFSSYANGYFLISREAPTPAARSEEITVPYIQGSLEFSHYRGIRYFNNRIVTFKIFKPNVSYADIKLEILNVRSVLLSQDANVAILTDSYTPKNTHWRGCCLGVECEETSGGLLLTVEFNVYPLLFVDIDPIETDVWDEFNFITSVAQEYALDLKRDMSVWFVNFSYSKSNLHAQIIGGEVNPGAYVEIHNQKNELKNTKNKQYIGNLEIGQNLIHFKNIQTPIKLNLLFTAEILC